MDTLIVLCLALSSSFAAPQQYVPPNPPESTQLQNPGSFNSAPTTTNNAFLPNAQSVQSFNSVPTNTNNGFLPNIHSVQTFPTTTEPILQGVLPMQFNQDQSSVNSQNTVNNQNPSIIRIQETTENINEYGQNSQDGFREINNAGSNILNNGFVSNSDIGKGQVINSNIDINDNLNNPTGVASTIGDFNQGTNNAGLPNIPKGSYNGNIVDNVEHNGNENELLVNSHTKVEMIMEGPIVNNANSQNNNFISDQREIFQNMEQLFSQQISNSNQNLNNYPYTGELEANTQGLRLNQNNANNENNDFNNEQQEDSQNHRQFISHQNSISNQNIDTNQNVGAAQNLEVTNEYDMNQVIQNTNDNQRGVIADKLMNQQKNEKSSRCGRGLIHDARGTCVRPEVNRNIYVYRAPKMTQNFRNTSIEIPKPKLEYNIVFVKTPEGNGNGEPIIVPPPQQKTLVYVLSKKKADGTQEIIEVPTGPKHDPEVYYVNYEEGDNPTLPGGIELKTALNAAVQTGQSVSDIFHEFPLREDISHDNITPTTNIGSKTEDTMFGGIGLQYTTGNNPENIASITPNNVRTSNNDEYTNNQLDPTYNMDAQRFNVAGSDKDFMNNNVRQNTAGVIVPQNVGSLNGRYSTTGGIVHQNVNILEGQNPSAGGLALESVNFNGHQPTSGAISHPSVVSLEGQNPSTGGLTLQSVSFNGQQPSEPVISHQSEVSLDVQRSTIGGIAHQRVSFTDQQPTTEIISSQSADSFDGQRSTTGGLMQQIVGHFDGQGSTLGRISPAQSAGNPPFISNEGGYNLIQALSTPPRQYNTY